MDKRISFSSDYTKGAHPRILERLQETNFEQTDGYGSDDYCKSAADRIKRICGCPDADVFFLVGGTQTNQVITDMLLQPYEGIIAADTGHIAVHEAGAIEHSGHKVLTIPHSGVFSEPSIMTPIMSIWFFRELYISLIPQSTEHSIPKLSLHRSQKSAESIICPFSSTVPVLATVL